MTRDEARIRELESQVLLLEHEVKHWKQFTPVAVWRPDLDRATPVGYIPEGARVIMNTPHGTIQLIYSHLTGVLSVSSPDAPLQIRPLSSQLIHIVPVDDGKSL